MMKDKILKILEEKNRVNAPQRKPSRLSPQQQNSGIKKNLKKGKDFSSRRRG